MLSTWSSEETDPLVEDKEEKEQITRPYGVRSRYK